MFNFQLLKSIYASGNFASPAKAIEPYTAILITIGGSIMLSPLAKSEEPYTAILHLVKLQYPSSGL